MRRSVRSLSGLAVLLLAGCLAAGCSSAAKSAIGNLPSRSITATSGTTATSAPSTPTVTVTATATSPQGTTTTAPATGSAAPSAGSGSSLIWLWILLGVVVLAGLIALIAHSARRRSATGADWRTRLLDAYAQGSALHDAMSVAAGGMAAADAGARWSDIQRRADDYTQTLYALREAASDPGDRARIADTLASLQAARSALDAQRVAGGQDEVVRSRLFAFESSLRALRSGDEGSL
jgi:hypothetical protein